jgi:ASC-1-like (ASCH) protein
MRHTVKIEDCHYENILDGRKRFEVRYNDRNYQLGDELEFTKVSGLERLGSSIFKIIFVQSGYGLKENFVVLGIELGTEAKEQKI